MIESKINKINVPFYLLPQTLNAIQSTTTKNSIDSDTNTKPSIETNEKVSNVTFIEQKPIQFYVGNLMNIEPSQNDTKSVTKSSYQIPSPTILLPDEFSASSKPILSSNMIINKIQRSTPIENNRNLLVFNQANSFYLKNRSSDKTEELISNPDQLSTSSINSLNLSQPLSLSNAIITPQQLQISQCETLTVHQIGQTSILTPQPISPPKQPALILPRFVDKPILSNRFIHSPIISLSQMANSIDNDLHSNQTSVLSQDLDSPLVKLIRDKIDNENIPFEFAADTSSFEISPQTKIRHETKHVPESLWKTKLSLKTLLSMANRDEAQALKDRKPIDYHMFLSNKFNKNSILQYNDYTDLKFTAQTKHLTVQQFNEQDYKENRKLYKRLLNTMGLRKPGNIKTIESTTSIKQIKRKRRIKTIPLRDDSIQYSKNDKPILITYQARPISVLDI